MCKPTPCIVVTLLCLAIQCGNEISVDAARSHRTWGLQAANGFISGEQLQRALEQNDIEHLRTPLSQNLDVLANPPRDFRRLFVTAIAHSEWDIVDFFLRHLENINLELDVDTGRNALQLSVEYGRLSITENILKFFRPNLDARDSSGNTALHIAVDKNSREAVKLLLETGADPNIPDAFGIFPVFTALANSHLDILLLLSQHEAKLDVLMGYEAKEDSSHNGTALVYSLDVFSRNYRRLNDHFFARHFSGENILTFAVRKGDIDSVRFLIERLKFPVDSVNAKGQTALFLALRLSAPHGQGNTENTHDFEIVSFLWTSGADPSKKDKEGTPALFSLAQLPSMEQVLFRTSKRPSTNTLRRHEDEDIERASQDTTAYKFLEMFLSHPQTNLDTVNAEGDTLLLVATKFGRKYLVRELLSRGANYRAQTKTGDNIVHLAVEWRDCVMLEMILSSLSENTIYTLLQQANAAGLVPIDVATKNEDSNAIRVIKKYMPK